MIRAIAVLFLLLLSPALAQTNEQKTATLVERLKSNPAALRALLAEMPKGGDLHHHLDGAVWAEHFLKWADEDGSCIDARTHEIILSSQRPECPAGQVPARGLMVRDPAFYQKSIDALSVRNFVPGLGTGEVSEHDHVFATFPRFGAIFRRHLGQALAVTRQQAAADHIQYLEQIAAPSNLFAPELLGAIRNFKADNLEAAYTQVLPLLPALIAAGRAEFDAAETRMKSELKCGTPAADAGCAIEARYLFYAVRLLPPEQVFAQAAFGFALASADPRFVGVNLVAPEDDAVAIRDFSLHMQMYRFLAGKYPGVKRSMHAGEIVLGLVPPSALGFHIRDTIEIAGATRIGHGYEIPYERDAGDLLKQMATKDIAVEINLTSNDMSPSISGRDHPLRMYMRANVPIVLSADDGGVFRIDLTHEYVRAAVEQGLTYPQLKAAARNGIHYSFLPGQSLWKHTPGGTKVSVCLAAGRTCDRYLEENPKAALETKLEQELARFEAEVAAGGFMR